MDFLGTDGVLIYPFCFHRFSFLTSDIHLFVFIKFEFSYYYNFLLTTKMNLIYISK